MLSRPKLGILKKNDMSINWSYPKMSTVKVGHINFLLKIKIELDIIKNKYFNCTRN